MSGEVLATLAPAPARRVLALAMLWSLAGLLVLLAAERTVGFAATAFLVLMAALIGLLAEALRHATRVALVLTNERLEDSRGRVLFEIEEIELLDRGLFAIKPPNGFSVVLKSRRHRVWQPGLWWQLGRRIGIGGVTSPAAGKYMAEILAQRLAKVEL
ncbi:MAG: hypothetical protein AAF330_05765 [Pseudomonadota bacterium]